MSWQTRVRALLFLVVVGLAGGITWFVMKQTSQAGGPPPVSPRTDKEAETEVAGGRDTRTDAAGNTVFDFTYDGLLTYPQQNRVKLLKVVGKTTRNNQPIEFRADEADVKLKSGAGQDVAKFDEMLLKGNVSIKSAPGPDALLLETSEALYNDLTGMMTTEKPVKMKRGAMSGSGTGATLDRERAVVWLLADAKVSLATEGQGTLQVTSGRAGLAENEKYFRFEEHVRMEREGRIIQTDAAVANLTPDGKSITNLELRGNSRVTGGGRGDVPNMQADDITISYGAESGLLERAVLMRNARLDLPEGGRRTLAAGHIDLGFGGDGSTLTVLDASEAVELKIPADRDIPAREVRAPRLEARGAVPKGLDRAQFTGGVEFRERAPAAGRGASSSRVGCTETDSPDRVGCSDSLALVLDGGFNKITTADFSGNVRFRDKDTTGTAPEARYNVDSKQVALRGGNTLARVTQEDGTIDAKDIDLTLDPRKLIAKGGVRSTLKAGSRRDRNESRPSILEDDQPVNVTAATLNYDGVADRAVYTGDARLWQGTDTTIQADTIVLDDKSGNLEARTNMRGIFLIRETPQPGRKETTKPTTVTADEMVYEEGQRRATFRGTAKKPANLQGPEGNISAERIEVFVLEDGNTLDRAEAYGTVTARLEGDRVATGNRMTYKAGTRVYTMTGAPLVLTRKYDDKATGQRKCEETQGATLTFERATDRVEVKAANGGSSRTVNVSCTAK